MAFEPFDGPVEETIVYLHGDGFPAHIERPPPPRPFQLLREENVQVDYRHTSPEVLPKWCIVSAINQSRRSNPAEIEVHVNGYDVVFFTNEDLDEPICEATVFHHW